MPNLPQMMHMYMLEYLEIIKENDRVSKEILIVLNEIKTKEKEKNKWLF